MNPTIAVLSRIGISVAGSRILEVKGRRSGAPRRNPVNPIDLEGKRYLVSPRGNTQWVRNIRAAGEGDLLHRGRRERFRAREIGDEAKEPILRAYLRRWKWEVGKFFGGVSADSSSAELARIAPEHPVFLLEPREGEEEDATAV